MINFLLVKDKEIPVYLKYWYYKTKIEGLVFNKIYEATKVGTSLVLDNTIEHTMKINLLSSDTTQFTTNGYQLFDKNHANILNATFSETKTLAASTNGKTLYISCKPNTTYTIKKTSSQRFRILTTEEEPNIGVIGIQYIAGFTETTQKITTDSNVNYLCVYYYLNGTDTKTEQEILDSIMIYEGSETLPYEPYTGGQPSPNPDYPQNIHVVKGDNTILISNSDDTIEQSYTITLGDVELCKIGSYQDLIFKNTSDSEYYDSTLEKGKWYKYARIGKIILDGSENITMNYNNSMFRFPLTNFKRRIDTGAKSGYVMSNYYANVWYSDMYDLRVDYGIEVADSTGDYLYIRNKDMTISDFKAWLSTHNTIVYYILSEPTKTPLSDTLQTQSDDIYNNAHTYDKITNITQVNDDRPFILNVSYFRKVKYNE